MSQIIRHIIPIAQPPESNLCWAATTAMILHRPAGPTVLTDIVSQAKTAGVPLQDDGRLDPSSAGLSALARGFGLKYKDVVLGLRDDIVNGLGKGPIGLFGMAGFSWAKKEMHAVAIHGIVINEAKSTAQILGVDPRGFTAINMDFDEFCRVFNSFYVVYRG